MRALRFDGVQAALETKAPEPILGPGDALIRPLRLGIAGADLAVCRALSTFTGVLGHEFVGVVERLHPAVSADDQRRLQAKRVVGSINIVCGQCDLCRRGLSSHCRTRRVLGLAGHDGCFADRFTLPIRNLHPVPDAIDNDAAVFAEPLARALHAAQMVRIETKTYITILGDGSNALLAAQVMARLNASVRLLGRSSKLELCEKWGVKHRHEAEAGRRADQDIIVDCTGSPTGLALALRLVRPRGSIILTSPPVPTVKPQDPGLSAADLAHLAANEISLLGSRGSSIPDALHTLASGSVDVLSLITRRCPLGDGQSALQHAAAPDQLKVLMEL